MVEIGLGIFLFVNREKVADAIRDKTVQDFEVSRKDNTDLFAKYQSGVSSIKQRRNVNTIAHF